MASSPTSARTCGATRRTGVNVVDCKGHVLAPGLIDAQVFTGEPGFEHRETLKTASHAAAAGGVTTMVVMPETNPVIDQVALVDFIQRRARDNAIVHVHTMAAMTKGLKGEEMTEIGLLKRAGAIAFSNGKACVANTRVMRNVLLYAKDFGALIVHHTEDPYLASSGAMNSGEVAARLGLPGVPKASETIMLERDVRLVEMTRGRYHAATISCAESLEVIRNAKARKLPVTCGVSINHLTLNENDIGPYRTFFKMRPPLRSDDDRAAMIRGLASGDIDIIVSSHDPQDADDKRRPFAEATDGAVGLETLLPAALRLYHSGELPLLTILRALTINPGQAARPAFGQADQGRHRRHHPVRPRRAVGREQGPAALALQEHAVRREQDAGARAAHSGCRRNGLPVPWRRADAKLRRGTRARPWTCSSVLDTLAAIRASAICSAPSPSAIC